MKIALLLLLIFFFIRESVALLKVIDSASRQFKTLDGFWDFLPDYSAESVNEKWWLKPLETVSTFFIQAENELLEEK